MSDPEPNYKLGNAMRELVPVMEVERQGLRTETVWYAALGLLEKGMLDVSQNKMGGTHYVTFSAGDAKVLEFRAGIDAHTGQGFQPPSGTLYVTHESGKPVEEIPLIEASYKLWG